MDAFRLTGPDLLVHGSNLILLFAYTRREMLSLRILALVAAVTIIPYYALQPTVLWPPLLWSGSTGWCTAITSWCSCCSGARSS